jgi:O-succinylbenzoic acid--CoA ligase
VDAAAFRDAVERRRHRLAQAEPGGGTLRLLEASPVAVDFIAGAIAALTAGMPVHAFLGSPRWNPAECDRARVVVRPHLAWPGEVHGGAAGAAAVAEPAAGRADEPMIWIPTGGTTGGLRFAGHTWGTLAAAAGGLRAWLGGGPVHAVCCLPLHHVSGLMQVVRAFASGGSVALAEWAAIESGAFPEPGEAGAVLSLVPTQLARLLDVAGGPAWLRRFRAVFVGGAAVWPALMERARAERLPLAPCYGSTETAAQVVAARPEDFLAGVAGGGRALPHATVEIVDEAGGVLPPGEPGRVRVRAKSVFLGYWPRFRRGREVFTTGDRGVLAPDGSLSVLGRADGWINTGGEKVDPAEVEAAVRETGMVGDVAVVGLPDAAWGERVVAVVAATVDGWNEEAMRERLRERLAAHAVPKRFVCVSALPRNEAGKLDRAAAAALATRFPQEPHEACHGRGSP